MKLTLLLFTGILAAPGTQYTVDPAQSVFAVVTHKTGVAAALAHNHFVYAREYTCEIQQPGDALESGQFNLTFPTTNLVADDPAAKTKWYPRIEALRILDEPFPEISEKDRAKIRETMLSKEQLDAAQFPDIRAEVKGIKAAASKHGKLECTHNVTLALTVHGKTVEHEVPVRIEVSGDTAKVEGAGKFAFTEFGIKPYSAMMGAVKVTDGFDVYVNLVAKRK
jgi:hypothetical protein